MNSLPEPSDGTEIGGVYHIVATWFVPYLCYYLGIFIRKQVYPLHSDLSLTSLFLLAIPICLVIMTPAISLIQDCLNSNWVSYMFILGIIMEHGMVVHERATKGIGGSFGSKAPD